MRITALWAAAALLASAVAAVQPQTPFALAPDAVQPKAPAGLDSIRGHLVSLETKSKTALERAIEYYNAKDADVWLAGKRTRTADGQAKWSAVARLDGDFQEVEESTIDASTPASDTTEEGAAPLFASIVPLEQLVAENPTVATSYSRDLSVAAVANLSRALEAGKTIRLDDPIHDTYHPYNSIHEILTKFEDAFPGWVKVVSIGQSSEGREIWGVKVTKPDGKSAIAAERLHAATSSAGGEHAEIDVGDDSRSAEEEEEEDREDEVGPPPLFSTRLRSHKRNKHPQRDKLQFVIAGTQHAREWIAASTILYLIHDLVALDERGKVPHRQLLGQVEFTFVPVVNPDGYVYSWEHDRLWRKSRQPVGKRSLADDASSTSSSPREECFGIDLNRNWGYKFQPGIHPNPCSDSYPGAEAFESVELRALRDYMLNGAKAFLDIHSFGQMLMFPYSYSCDVETRDQENHYEAVLHAAKALRDVHGRVFETGSVCEVSLTSPGESLDWAYASAKIRWSFGTELRDAGIFGFLLPPAQIRPSGEEMSAALRRLTQFILDKEAGKR